MLGPVGLYGVRSAPGNRVDEVEAKRGVMALWNNKQNPTPAPNEARPIPVPLPQPIPLKQEEPLPMAMMKREESPASAGASDLLLGEGCEFEGKLTFKGTVRIDAKFKGSILSNDVLIVGEHARIDAEITCGTVVVHGEVNGNIKAKTAVELHHPAKVRGNVETPSLVVEKGVFLQGEMKMENLDKAAPVKFVSPPGVSAVQ
jgi:cytoskeletal protein CcmA (bactofilin family)